MVPSINLFKYLLSALFWLGPDSQQDPGLQGLGNKYYCFHVPWVLGIPVQASFPAKCHPHFCERENTFHEVVMPCVGNITEISGINLLIMKHI